MYCKINTLCNYIEMFFVCVECCGKHGKIIQEVFCVEKQSKYNEIVKAIIQDIDQGILQARDRLPRKRNCRIDLVFHG